MRPWQGPRSAVKTGTWMPARAWVRVALLAIAATALVGAPAVVAAEEKGPQYRVDDVSLVYLGNPRLFKKPCAVSADQVYRAIPEYKEILEKGLTDKDPKYHFLMKKASEKFSRAIGDVAKADGYDLVAGIGAVVPVTPETPAVPDVTTSVIAKIPAS